MTRKAKIAVTVTATAVIVAAVAVLFLNDPTEAGFYPRCPSKLVTGYDCPGCGSLRGLHALLHGDFAAAWAFNPAIFFAIGLLAAIGLAGLSRTALNLPQWLARLSRSTARITDHPAFPVTILIAIIAWTILRNV